MNAIQFFEWGSKGKYFLKRIYDNLVTDNVIVQYRYGEKWCPAKVLSKKYIEENNPALKYKECIILEADFTKTPIFAEFFYITIIDDPILFSLKEKLSWEIDDIDIKNNSSGIVGNKLNIIPFIDRQILTKKIEKEKIVVKIYKKQ